MDVERARDLISVYVKEKFGRIVEPREVSVVRRASGRAWVGELYCMTRLGEVKVGEMTINEAGNIISGLSVDQLIDALASTKPVADIDEGQPIAEDDFSDLSLDEPVSAGGADFGQNDELDDFFTNLDTPDLYERIERLISSGSRDGLLEARELLPQLLSNPIERGSVLRTMGELEIELGETGLGLNYLEAAAREFANHANIETLDQVAERMQQIIGSEEYSKCSVKMFAEHLRLQMNPIDAIRDMPIFAGLGPDEIFEIEGVAQPLRINAGDVLLKENDEAVHAFLVRSGILSVWLEAPDGKSRMVRCCFPGDLVGESSVLGEKGATCSATVVADRPSNLWRFEGDRLRSLAKEFPKLGMRLESTLALNRLDSFFSMNRITGDLDVPVRDRLYGCIVKIRDADPGDVLGTSGKLPEIVYMVAKGSVEYRRPGAQSQVYAQDSFVGLRDALHGLPLEGDYVVAEAARLICFDADGLRTLASESPPEVVAVLERLE